MVKLNEITRLEIDKLQPFLDKTYTVKKTRDNVTAQLKKLIIYTGKSFKDSVNDIDSLKFLGFEMKNTKGQYMINTNASTISCIMSFLDKYRIENPDIIDESNMSEIKNINATLRTNKTDNNDLQKPTTTNTLEDFYNFHDSLDKDSLEYLYLACNLWLAPRRLEWRHCVFAETVPEVLDGTRNYVIIGDEYVRLIFDKYKSQVRKTLGVWDRVLRNDRFHYLKFTDSFSRINPENLGKLLKNSYENNPRLYVFGEHSESSFSDVYGTQLFSKSGKKMKQTNIRHLVIDKFVDLKPHLGLKKLFAEDCGQKLLETQMKYTTANEIVSVSEVMSEISPNDFINLTNVIQQVNISRATSIEHITVDDSDDDESYDIDPIEIKLTSLVNETENMILALQNKLKKQKEHLISYREIKEICT